MGTPWRTVREGVALKMDVWGRQAVGEAATTEKGVS
jgi:hypothetical protein